MAPLSESLDLLGDVGGPCALTSLRGERAAAEGDKGGVDTLQTSIGVIPNSGVGDACNIFKESVGTTLGLGTLGTVDPNIRGGMFTVDFVVAPSSTDFSFGLEALSQHEHPQDPPQVLLKEGPQEQLSPQVCFPEVSPSDADPEFCESESYSSSVSSSSSSKLSNGKDLNSRPKNN